MSKYWEFWALKKLPHGCPKWADTKVTSRLSKMRGGGSRPLLDNVQKKDAFFMDSPIVIGHPIFIVLATPICILRHEIYCLERKKEKELFIPSGGELSPDDVDLGRIESRSCRMCENRV